MRHLKVKSNGSVSVRENADIWRKKHWMNNSCHAANNSMQCLALSPLHSTMLSSISSVPCKNERKKTNFLGGEPCGGLQLRLQLAGPWLAQLEDGLRAAPIAWHYTDSNPHSVPKYCRLGGILFITIALVQ